MFELFSDGRYRAQFSEETEAGTWTLTSCVGRVSLMLAPGKGASYGFILRRDGRKVVLNEDDHTVAPLSGS